MNSDELATPDPHFIGELAGIDRVLQRIVPVEQIVRQTEVTERRALPSLGLPRRYDSCLRLSTPGDGDLFAGSGAVQERRKPGTGFGDLVRAGCHVLVPRFSARGDRCGLAPIGTSRKYVHGALTYARGIAGMQPRHRTTTTIGKETAHADSTSTTNVPASAPALPGAGTQPAPLTRLRDPCPRSLPPARSRFEMCGTGHSSRVLARTENRVCLPAPRRSWRRA